MKKRKKKPTKVKKKKQRKSLIQRFRKKRKKIKNIRLKLLGKHNVLNAAAAVTVCVNLGVGQNIIKESLKNFSGVQRRMTKIFTKNKNDFYDDYAHLSLIHI